MNKYKKGDVIAVATVALGEVHGHAHIWKGLDAEITAVEDFEDVSERMAMMVTGKKQDGGAIITHEEHDAMFIEVKLDEKIVFVSGPTFEFDPLTSAIIRARD